MLKIVGVIMTLTGSVGLGIWYRTRFGDRLAHIRILFKIMEGVVSQMQYGRTILPESVRWLQGDLGEPYEEAFERLWRMYLDNTGQSYGELLAECLNQCMEEAPLEKEEKRIVREAFSNVGCEDASLLLGGLERAKAQLKQLENKLAGELAQKGKMAVSLGVMGGLLLTIILL